MNTSSTPEIGRSILAAGIRTNLHDAGEGTAGASTVLLIHGSGPGVTAWANWRLTIPELAMRSRVLAERLGAAIDTKAASIGDPPCLVYRHPAPESLK